MNGKVNASDVGLEENDQKGAYSGPENAYLPSGFRGADEVPAPKEIQGA